ncbi:hypothetical protein Tco_1106295 [Tanacetum coccineum]
METQLPSHLGTGYHPHVVPTFFPIASGNLGVFNQHSPNSFTLNVLVYACLRLIILDLLGSSNLIVMTKARLLMVVLVLSCSKHQQRHLLSPGDNEYRNRNQLKATLNIGRLSHVHSFDLKLCCKLLGSVNTEH